MAMAAGILAAGLALTAPPTERRTIQATAGQMLTLAEEMVRRGDSRDAENILDLLARDPNPNVRNEARFRRAMLLEAGGRNEAAAVHSLDDVGG